MPERQVLLTRVAEEIVHTYPSFLLRYYTFVSFAVTSLNTTLYHQMSSVDNNDGDNNGENDAVATTTLVAMGFDAVSAGRALRVCDGDLESAANFLLASGGFGDDGDEASDAARQRRREEDRSLLERSKNALTSCPAVKAMTAAAENAVVPTTATNGDDNAATTAPSNADNDASGGGHDPSPRFYPTSEGHMTRSAQRGWLESEINAGRLPEGALIDDDVTTLRASSRQDDPLYFWQIFSLIGRPPLFRLAERFYTNVFQDEDEWFWRAFGRPDVKHHALFFCMTAMDCFGGGRYYAGGEERLDDVHHASAHSFNEASAVKWSTHMRNALDALQECELDDVDVRIRPAMDAFFRYYMNRYAVLYGFDTKNVRFSSLRLLPSPPPPPSSEKEDAAEPAADVNTAPGLKTEERSEAVASSSGAP